MSIDLAKDYEILKAAYQDAQKKNYESFDFTNEQGTHKMITKYAGYLLDYYEKTSGQTPHQSE